MEQGLTGIASRHMPDAVVLQPLQLCAYKIKVLICVQVLRTG